MELLSSTTTTPSSLLAAESELRDVEQSICLLQARRELLQQYISAQKTYSHRNQVSIHNVPPEILVEIFRCCLLPDRYHDDAVDTRRAPWHLAQVCQTWRNIILSTPSLWSRIDLCLGHPKEDVRAIRRVIALLTFRIQRTADLPLRLHVKVWRGTVDHPVFQTLLTHSHRWQEVKFTASYSLMNYMSQHKGNYPQLKSFQWSLRNLDLATPSSGFDALKFAPQLKKVVFSNVDVSLGMVKAPWVQLTNISLQYDTADARNLLSLLSQTKNLEHCELYYRKLLPLEPGVAAAAGVAGAIGGTDESPHSVVRLPNLRSLSIAHVTAQESSSILPFLHLPALEALTVQTITSTSLLINLLRNSSCWLTTFRVTSGAAFPWKEMLPLMREMPCVRELDVTFCITEGKEGAVVDEEFANELMYRGRCGHDEAGASFGTSSSPTPFPCLESIHLTNVRITDGPLFTDMISSRFWSSSASCPNSPSIPFSVPTALACPITSCTNTSNSPAKLRSVAVVLNARCLSFSMDVLERWRVLRRMGCDVSLQNPRGLLVGEAVRPVAGGAEGLFD